MSIVEPTSVATLLRSRGRAWGRSRVRVGPPILGDMARSVGVWRQISDMLSFWIRPEYVVDYRPILDAPVDAAGEVVEEIMLYCC